MTAANSKRMDFSRFPRQFVPKHEALFFEDDESRSLYVLLTGALGIYRNEVQVATVDEPLSVIGEISALTGQPRNATVRALEPTTVVLVEDPDALFEEYPQLGAKLARMLALRLAAMNGRFVELKGLVHRSRSQSGPIDATTARARMDAETLPPGQLPGSEGSESAPHPVAPPAAVATSSPATPPEADDMMGALSDLLDWDPSLNALT